MAWSTDPVAQVITQTAATQNTADYSSSAASGSPLASYTETAAYIQKQAAMGGEASTYAAALVMNIGPAAGQISILYYLKQASFPEVLQAIRCGKLDALKCLCDPYMRAAAATLDERFTRREQAALFDTLCGCAVPAAPPAQANPPPPASGDVPINFKPTPNTPPAKNCDLTLPAKGSMTNGS